MSVHYESDAVVENGLVKCEIHQRLPMNFQPTKNPTAKAIIRIEIQASGRQQA